ncbi:hypothetical protein [Kitasatospora cineracea]|uniref:hypothetical protein n=1 Tax=Kitasatospora cineracea TaxID=88074 RepID=UPI0036BDF9CB
MNAESRCGLCGVGRREHDRLWVDLVPHAFVPPTSAQILARRVRANSRARVAR